MALRSGYYGLKKSLLNKVKGLPGIKSIGSGLSLNSTTGELTATGATVAIEANPEGAATDNLVKLGIGEDIYAVPDIDKTYQTDDATESAIVDADYIPFFDSSAASGAGAPKKSTWSNFKSKLTEGMTALGTTITTPSDATVTSNFIYKFGKVVTAYLYATNITAEKYAGFATIPEGYRPKTEFISKAQGGTDSIYGVRTNGQIYNNKQALTSSDTVVFYATWITD